jgi:glycosyltransferase involved in cell wall biosynthesis
VWLSLRELIPDAQLTVIGRGLAAEEEELACMAGVTSVGWISPAELPGWSARSTVAILPWADTPANRARHSVKLLELMAAGSPIVAFAVGEVPATLDDAGMLVAPGDHAGFAAAVAAVIHDPALQARMGEAARARIARFTWDVLVDRALEAYELALGWQDREKGETHR